MHSEEVANLQREIDELRQKLRRLNERMICKKEVADRAGMTVSWLDNSQGPKARKLRQSGVRYGRSRTSPIRYPLQEVLRICLIDESDKDSLLTASSPDDCPTTAS